MNKRFIALALCVLTVFMSFGFCFASNYDETNGVGANKIVTNFTLAEEEGFKVSVPATNEISWFTGYVENSIEFSDVMIGKGRTMTFSIDVGNSTFYTSANKFTLCQSNDSSQQIMLDILVDDTTDFSCSSPQLFEFTSPVKTETHKIKFTIDKDYVDEDFPDEEYIPVTGETFEGTITYLINIV